MHLVDHSITIAQVFQFEGDYTEEQRQAILTKTRAAIQSRISGIQTQVISEIIEQGGKVAGKCRVFCRAYEYDPAIEAEFSTTAGPTVGLKDDNPSAIEGEVVTVVDARTGLPTGK